MLLIEGKIPLYQIFRSTWDTFRKIYSEKVWIMLYASDFYHELCKRFYRNIGKMMENGPTLLLCKSIWIFNSMEFRVYTRNYFDKCQWPWSLILLLNTVATFNLPRWFNLASMTYILYWFFCCINYFSESIYKLHL